MERRCVGFKRLFAFATTVLATMNFGADLAYAQGSLSPAELAAMKEVYKRPKPRPIENQKLVDLGRILFWDPRLSASGKTACASCHFPYLGWGVTDAKSRNDAGKFTSRKSQPLIGIGHAEGAPFGWDGRNASLEAQAKASIANGSMSMRDTDAPVAVEVIEQRVEANPEYVTTFEAALPGAPISIDTMAKAIATFERSLEPGIAPFDHWIEGDEGAISEWAKRGFVLFNGKANCSRCHVGWRFTDDLFHDIGTSTTDLGRGRELKTEPLMQHAFKTPTLRSVALRPPYMHNASAADLYEAVRHYEKRGIDRPSRSPLMETIELSEQERRDLVAFLQTLTGLRETEAPPKLPGQTATAR
jgi:cytochrome c peroxidase